MGLKGYWWKGRVKKGYGRNGRKGLEEKGRVKKG
jgi:hypothetical protein